MFDNRIEIVSPGGLPSGITKDEYINGRYSLLRNPILADVFLRLNLIEEPGTYSSRRTRKSNKILSSTIKK